MNHRVMPILAVVLCSLTLAVAQPGPGLQIQDTDTGGVTPTDLVNLLLGPNSDAVVSNVVLTGDPRCAGDFSGGTGILGFEKGIVLGAGRVIDAVGPNSLDDTTTEFGTGGDADLDTLVTNTTTFDACTLEFDFTCGGVETVSFTYQFTSEEYNEYANSQFNNVFGFFLNGTNIALLPDGVTPVSINNVNGGGNILIGEPFGVNAQNPAFFINNDCDDGPCSINIEADGLTVVLDAESSIDSSSNHIKLGVADSGDAVFDSWVFLKAGSFQCEEVAPPPSTPLSTVSEQAEGPNTNARSGTSVAAAGDLNHNPEDDYVTGAPGFEDQPSVGPGTGAALVYFGSTVESERGTVDIEFIGENDHDRVGIAVASNFDFNLDGTNDILIGGEQVNRSGMNVAACDDGEPCGAGVAYLIYFDPTDTINYPNIADVNAKDTVFLSDVGGAIPGVKFTGVNLGDQMGFSVAGGEFKTDNSGPEIAIGAPSAEVDIDGDGSIQCTPGVNETECDVGKVYLIFNDPSLSGTVDISRVANGNPTDEIDGIVYVGDNAGDSVGFDVAFVGDVVPGDPLEAPAPDLAIGAPKFDVEVDASLDIRLADAGAAFVAAGGDSSLEKGIIDVCRIGDTSGPGVDAAIADGVRIQGDQDGEQLGYSVARGGDNQGDGEQDLLIGAPFYDKSVDASVDVNVEDVGRLIQSAGSLEKGIIDVCRVGDTSGGPTTDADEPVPGAQYIGANEGDKLGFDAAGVNDTTGDGAEEIVIGAPGFDVERNVSGTTVTDVDAGAVYVVAGEAGGTDALVSKGIIDVDRIGVTVAGNQVLGDSPGDESGTSVADLGDHDGDGSGDFLVGSPGKNTQGLTDNGNVSVVTKGTNLGVTQPNQPPLASAGADQLLECDGGGAATAMLSGAGSSDTDSTPGTNDNITSFLWYEFFGTIDQTLVASAEQDTASLGLGAHTITLEVADVLGLKDQDSLTVTVQDMTPPNLACPLDATAECESNTQAQVGFVATASDTCDAGTTVANDYIPAGGADASGSYPIGTTVVTFAADDSRDNSSECSASVTVQDTTDPVLSCPQDLIADCVDSQALVSFTATATDDCDSSSVVITNDSAFGVGSGADASGSYPLGTTDVTFAADDSRDNSSECSASVTVQDITPPVLTCPADVVVECAAGQGVVVLDQDIVLATADEDCDASAVSIVNDYTANGANAAGTYPLGTTVVTYTATDGAGLTASCVTNVTVEDNFAPTVSVTATPDSLWPPNHKLKIIDYDVTVADQCGASVVLYDLVSNEPDDVPGDSDGETINDIQDAVLGTPDFKVKLRAERDDEGAGRTYTATYLATDLSGQTATATAGVFVPHDQRGNTEPLDVSVDSGTNTVVSWPPVTNAQHFDVVRGDVASLMDDGTSIQLGAVTCIENQSLDGSTAGNEDQAMPAPGQAFFYAVQYYDGLDESSYGTETADKPRVVSSGDCH